MIIYLDQQALQVANGLSVAAAVAGSADPRTRTSCSGQPRSAFCGMGICQECRVTVDGQRRLACQTLCRDGMRVERSQ